MTIVLTAREESAFRLCADGARCPVNLIGGSDLPPTRRGKRAYHTFRGSETRVRYPGAALRRGLRLDYHRSDYRVEVGEIWVRRWRGKKIEKSVRCKLLMKKLAKTFAPGAPRYAMADYLLDQGDQAGATLLRELEALLG